MTTCSISPLRQRMMPKPIADIAYQNKAVVYDILFKAAAETLITIAAEPKHLGARIGFTAVLHTWGSALPQRPLPAEDHDAHDGPVHSTLPEPRPA